MPKRFIIICFFIQLSFGCTNSIKDDLSVPGFADVIKKIVIYNKTGKDFNSNKLEIIDKDKIRKICSEIKKLEEVSHISTKANFGFYETELISTKNRTYSLDVVYTVYNGVIIDIN